MTGMNELRNVEVVSAAPEVIRVSVLGGRTQLDIALPADMPIAAFLPELARLIGSRDTRRDDDMSGRDERRTFWVLSRVEGGVDGDTALALDETLCGAGVANGEVLRISPQRALSPPTLHDDVVDAAARLNRASYAAWDATAAAKMAFAGLWLCTAAWVYFLVADAFTARRVLVVGGAVLTAVCLAAGAALAHRAVGRTDIATAAGWPVIAISSAVGWAVASRWGDYGLAGACVVLMALAAAYFLVVGTGHWAYIAASVVFGFGAVALLARALGGHAEVLAAVAATVAALGALAAPTLTAKLGRFPAPTIERAGKHKNGPLENPFSTVNGAEPGAAMPSAEQVWARVRSAALTRAGLLVGLAAVVVVGATMLLRIEPGWPAFVFALACAAVLALRSRSGSTVAERAALAVPATALLLIGCVLAQGGVGPLRLGGVGVLVAVALVAVLAGLAVSGGRRPGWVSTAAVYLEYASAAALMPLALWPLEAFDRLGL